MTLRVLKHFNTQNVAFKHVWDAKMLLKQAIKLIETDKPFRYYTTYFCIIFTLQLKLHNHCCQR